MSMAGMNIKDPEVRELAIKLAQRRHTTMTDAVRQSLAEALGREPEPERDREGIAAALRQLAIASAAKPGRFLTDEELYDDNGLPI